MIRTALLLAATLAAPSAARAQMYKLAVRLTPEPGQSVVAKAQEKASVRHKLSAGGEVKDSTEVTSSALEYTETVKARAGGRATEFERKSKNKSAPARISTRQRTTAWRVAPSCSI